MSNKNDAMVLQLWEKVKAKKKEISAVEKPKWRTSCTIGRNPEIVTDRINIQTVTDVRKLVDIYGFVMVQAAVWEDAVKELGVKLPFVWMGYSDEDWKSDIKARVSQVSLNEKRKELEALEQRLDGLISIEQRRELELAEIAKQLE